MRSHCACTQQNRKPPNARRSDVKWDSPLAAACLPLQHPVPPDPETAHSAAAVQPGRLHCHAPHGAALVPESLHAALVSSCKRHRRRGVLCATQHLPQDSSTCLPKVQTAPSNHQGACMPLQMSLGSKCNEGGLPYKRVLACLDSCMGHMQCEMWTSILNRNQQHGSTLQSGTAGSSE